MEHHHFLAGKIHYFYDHVQVRKLLVITGGRVFNCSTSVDWAVELGPSHLSVQVPYEGCSTTNHASASEFEEVILQ